LRKTDAEVSSGKPNPFKKEGKMGKEEDLETDKRKGCMFNRTMRYGISEGEELQIQKWMNVHRAVVDIFQKEYSIRARTND